MRAFLQDLQYGGRIIRKQPGYSLLIVLTLALAIGANTVIFSFTNILLLRPLPLKDQDTLAWIFMIDPQKGGSRGTLSVPDLLDYRASLTSFQSIAATTSASYTLTGRGDALPVTATRVTANIIDTWGLRMAAGRPFAPDDDRPGAGRVALLSHTFWQRQFAGDPSIVGQALTLNGQPYTVLGVVGPEIEIGNLSTIEVWTPLTLDPSLPRNQRTVRVSARLAPGATFDQAAVEVRDVSRRLTRDHPDTNAGWEARLAPTREAMTGTDTWVVLGLLMLVVGFVLLIACANIANMVLARATGRRRELAVRAALGASRLRMVRQLLTESVLLGVLGGAVGLAFAYGGLRIIKAAAYEPFFELVVIDGNVLWFTVALSIVTPLVFSLLPALHASRTDLNDALKDSSTRTGGGLRGRRSRAALVVSQLALAMTLLIVSGLLLRTMIAITGTPLGFEPDGLATMRLEAPEWKYGPDASVTDFYARLSGRLSALPGVQQVAVSDRLPNLGSEATVAIDVDGRPSTRPEDRPWAVPIVVSEAFFATAGIPIVAGRGLLPQDDAAGMPVAVVNVEMARRYWGDSARALDSRVALDTDPRRWIRVVGVSGDVKRADLRGANPSIYLPLPQRPQRAVSILVRASNPDGVLAAMRSEVRALDRDVPVQQIRTLEEAFDDELSSGRILNGMFTAFALLALVLAGSGLYGVVSYSVSQRVQEIGIRLALGAVPSDIRRLIARQTLLLVAIGVAIGLAGGAAIASATSSLFYDVSATDPSTYIAVAGLLALVAAAATLAPLRRAVRIDPLVALRTE
jgi:putative ABC transport system permease protein